MGIPKGMPYSPKTTIVGSINETEDVITVADDSVFPDISGDETFIAVISSHPQFASWDPDDYETIEVAELDRNNNQLKQVTRDVERDGENKAWPDGTYIACMLTWELMERLEAKAAAGGGGGGNGEWEDIMVVEDDDETSPLDLDTGVIPTLYNHYRITVMGNVIFLNANFTDVYLRVNDIDDSRHDYLYLAKNGNITHREGEDEFQLITHIAQNQEGHMVREWSRGSYFYQSYILRGVEYYEDMWDFDYGFTQGVSIWREEGGLDGAMAGSQYFIFGHLHDSNDIPDINKIKVWNGTAYSGVVGKMRVQGRNITW